MFHGIKIWNICSLSRKQDLRCTHVCWSKRFFKLPHSFLFIVDDEVHLQLTWFENFYELKSASQHYSVWVEFWFQLYFIYKKIVVNFTRHWIWLCLTMALYSNAKKVHVHLISKNKQKQQFTDGYLQEQSELLIKGTKIFMKHLYRLFANGCHLSLD